LRKPSAILQEWHVGGSAPECVQYLLEVDNLVHANALSQPTSNAILSDVSSYLVTVT
jgi:hypothetical protein